MNRNTIALTTVSLSLALASGLACSKDADKPSGMPASADPSAATPPAPPMQRPPAMGKPMNVPEEAMGAPPAPEAKPDPAHSISGTITLPPARRTDVGKGDVIFVVARRPSDNPPIPGSLVAVKKTVAENFPLPFVLSASDMMIPGGTFEGDLTITVSVDKDGDPMTKRKGDVYGTLPKVAVGKQGVTIALDTLRTEDANLAVPPMGAGVPPMGGAAPMMGAGPGNLMPPGHGGGAMPAGHPGMPTGGAMPAGHPGMPGAMPAGHPPATAPATKPPGHPGMAN